MITFLQKFVDSSISLNFLTISKEINGIKEKPNVSILKLYFKNNLFIF